MALKAVSDPGLISALDAKSAPAHSSAPISDPQFIAQLEKSAGNPNTQAPQASSANDNSLNTVALGGRAVGEGVLGSLSGMAESFGKLGTGGEATDAILERYTGKNRMQHEISSFNQTFGTNIPEARSIPELLSSLLTKAGAPEPQSDAGKLAFAATKGAAGAATLAGGAGAANAVRTILAGTSGATSGELARQNGAGPVGQTLASLVGGLVPGTIENTVTGAYRLASNAVRPLTRGGQEQMAANIVADQAQDPAAAASNLKAAQDIVSGSARTSGEASQDLGLLALEKGVRGRNTDAFAERASEQNAARQAELARLGGTPQDIAAGQAARNAATTPLRDQAFANGAPSGARTGNVTATIDKLLDSPAGKRESVSSALNWAKDRIGNETDPASLYEIRKDLQLAQRGKLQPTGPNAPNASTLAQARGELGKVVEELDNAIESAAPGFQAYLKRYADLSRPIDQQKVIQEIQRRAEGTSIDVKTGENFLGSASYSRALDKVLASDHKLTAQQVQDLEAVRKDLQLGQAINQLKAPGSDTFQNLSIAQAIGAGPTDVHPILRVLSKPLSLIYKLAGSDNRVNELLRDAMLDPKVAAQMLDRATPANMQKFSVLLKRRLAASGLGAALSAGNTTAGTSEDQSTPGK